MVCLHIQLSSLFTLPRQNPQHKRLISQISQHSHPRILFILSCGPQHDRHTHLKKKDPNKKTYCPLQQGFLTFFLPRSVFWFWVFFFPEVTKNCWIQYTGKTDNKRDPNVALLILVNVVGSRCAIWMHTSCGVRGSVKRKEGWQVAKEKIVSNSQK